MEQGATLRVIQNSSNRYRDRDFVEGVYGDLQVEKEMMWVDLPDKKIQAITVR